MSRPRATKRPASVCCSALPNSISAPATRTAAARSADQAVASVLQTGIEQEQSVVLMVHALVQAHVGDLDVAQDGAERALALAHAGGDRIVVIRSRGVLGFIELSRGDSAAALAHLRPAGLELRALGIGELLDLERRPEQDRGTGHTWSTRRGSGGDRLGGEAGSPDGTGLARGGRRSRAGTRRGHSWRL